MPQFSQDSPSLPLLFSITSVSHFSCLKSIPVWTLSDLVALAQGVEEN